MDILAPMAAVLALAALAWLALRSRQRRQHRLRGVVRDALDTVIGWPPEAARILSVSERQGYDLLRRSMPGFLVLAQVPLSRFIRVPARHSYAEWLNRVGTLSADLMLCDAGSRVLAVVDVRAVKESDRSRRRHERMTRVLRAAGIHVFTWREGELPSVTEVRNALLKLVTPADVQAAANKPAVTRPVPLAPAAGVADALAAGDHAAQEADFDPRFEPVPSAFFEDLESSAEHRR